jgi:hypothetical protein
MLHERFETAMAHRGRPLILLLPIVAGLAGCADRPLPPGRAALLPFKGARIAIMERDTPAFAANRTASLLLGSAPPPAVAAAAGSALIRDNHVEDPAHRIRETLLGHLRQKLGLVPVAGPGKAEGDRGDPHQGDRAPAGADLLLDVQTTRWDYRFLPRNWLHYKVTYAAIVRIIDVRRSKVLMAFTCERQSPLERAPTHDELLANQAARLKQELASSAERCATALRPLLYPGKVASAGDVAGWKAEG